MNRNLVTGYTGFIGGHIIRALLQQGASIRGLTRQGTIDNAYPRIETAHGDLLKPDSITGIAKDIDCIFHAAGHAHAQGPNELIHQQTTLEGTRHLLREAEAHDVQRFIFISSVKAMPEPVDKCLDESDAGLPTDTYGLSRRAAEDLVLAAGQRTGMHVSILRPALVYGPGCKGNLASMMRWIDRGLFPPLPDTGNIRSMVDVRDLVRAILLAAESPAANGKVFIITDNEAYSTHRIDAALRLALGKAVPRWSVPARLLRILGRAGDSYQAVLKRTAPFNSAVCSRLLDSACYRSNRAGQVLGFRPVYRFEDALPAMVAAYRENQ